MTKPCYFVVSVSNRHNLELCIKYALAGFTNSIAGVWTFLEIQEGDFISFLYAARAHNLYEVVGREALENADRLPPWPPVTFRESGRTYYFPFRLWLKPVREFNEPLVRPEFAYIAENLLLRGGYRKTHFQADQTTLQNVSQMGSLWSAPIEPLQIGAYTTFTPLFTRHQRDKDIPSVFPFQEVILQAAIRQHLSDRDNLAHFLKIVGLDFLHPDDLEVLSEKATSEGHVDILVKDRVPIALARKVIVEVKLHRAQMSDLEQLKGYMEEFGKECIASALVAEDFPKVVVREAPRLGIRLVRYGLNLDWGHPRSFSEILSGLTLEEV